MRTVLILAILLMFGSSLPAAESEALHVGDFLLLTFNQDKPVLDGCYTVGKNGTINLPYIGEISVTGKNPATAQKIIVDTYLARKIFTRLELQLAKSPTQFMTIPNPHGPGTIRVPLSEDYFRQHKNPKGDFYSPDEKRKLFKIDQPGA